MPRPGGPLTGGGGIRVGVAVLAAAAMGLTLAAPSVLATSVTLGTPFVPFGASTSRLWTPIGLLSVALVVLALALWVPRWWPLLRRADLTGALLLGATLGLVVLTFASADPEREIVGPLGYALLPLAALTAGLYLWHHRTAADPLVPRGVVVGRHRFALAVSALVGVALVSVVVDVPLLANLVPLDQQVTPGLVLVRFLLAVPFGALAGGWLLRYAGAGLVAGAGLLLASAGLTLMTTWGRTSLVHWSSTVALVAVGLGIGLALAPVNDAALADAPADAHGTASALVVVARMVGMVIGLALLTAIGLRQYYGAVAALPDQTNTTALAQAAVVQVRWVFAGAGVAALLGAVVAALGLGLRTRAATDLGRPTTFGL